MRLFALFEFVFFLGFLSEAEKSLLTAKLLTPYILLDITTGAHIFRILKLVDDTLLFNHSMPGTGLRVAQVDFKPYLNSKELYITLDWTPSFITIKTSDNRNYINAQEDRSDQALNAIIMDKYGEEFGTGQGVSHYSFMKVMNR